MKKILFVNSTQPQCGVHQYGRRLYEIIRQSQKIRFIYLQCDAKQEYQDAVNQYRPHFVIYNYHPLTMPWFDQKRHYGEKHYQIHHEGSVHDGLKPDAYLFADCSVKEAKNIFVLPRPLFEGVPRHEKPEATTITSFGFGFGNKNYGSIVKMVNDQFDDATIRLHIPRAHFGDADGSATAQVVPGCLAEAKKPGIKLEFSHDFLTEDALLRFLSESHLNMFLYDKMEGRGLSSTIDYALSVDTPLAVNTSYMFRHIYDPAICANTTPLNTIIENGAGTVQKLRAKFSNGTLIQKIEKIFA